MHRPGIFYLLFSEGSSNDLALMQDSRPGGTAGDITYLERSHGADHE